MRSNPSQQRDDQPAHDPSRHGTERSLQNEIVQVNVQEYAIVHIPKSLISSCLVLTIHGSNGQKGACGQRRRSYRHRSD
jgi:hypothetical protein